MQDIKISKIEKSKIDLLDFDNIPLGRTFTDHMFICDYEDGQWQNARIVPLEPIATHPAAMALHYGQAIFEGMKATMHKVGYPMLFRPHNNAERFNLSADRMGMPTVSEELFVEALRQLVLLDQGWIPPQKGSALYLRPFMYADEAFIGMRAATHYKFVVVASPSAPLFSRPIKLYAETQYIRAAEGGTGEAKAAGNYAAAIRPTEMAKSKGYDQVLWLDAREFNYIQEVGTMNIFFMIDGVFITPSLDGSILHGITRLSIIELLRHKGYEVIERPITIEEVKKASEEGRLQEAFGTGTASSVAMISEIGYIDASIEVSQEYPIAEMLLDTLNGVRSGDMKDDLDWMMALEKDTVHE